jgi:hypothetical protein
MNEKVNQQHIVANVEVEEVHYCNCFMVVYIR